MLLVQPCLVPLRHFYYILGVTQMLVLFGAALLYDKNNIFFHTFRNHGPVLCSPFEIYQSLEKGLLYLFKYLRASNNFTPIQHSLGSGVGVLTSNL